MKIKQQWLIGFWLLSGVLLLATTLVKPPLPPKDKIITEVLVREPVQSEEVRGPFEALIGDFTYSFEPKFAYEQWGLVVERYSSSSWIDIYHQNDPANTHDLCVVWGETVANGSYKKVTYSHGQFTCYYRYSQAFEPSFDNTRFANNHMVPATKQIEKLIGQARVGDQIYLKGMLTDYSVSNTKGELVGNRVTSTTRDDTGNGACEVVYVEDFEIIKRGNLIWELVKEVSLIVAGVSTALLIFGFFFL